MGAAVKVRADMILRQLAKKHTQARVPDAFFTEVKNGSTWFSNNLLRLDAVAFKKSWKNPCITGYEVKVDRQDFLRDDKWPGYRQYCHRFFFACPTGLIAPDELPEDVGLIYYNQEKDCVRTKRTAAHRDVEIPTEMLYYLVVSRLKSDKHPFFSGQREYLEAWLQDKAERRDLGRRVGGKMVELLDAAEKKVARMERQAETDKEELECFERVKKIMKAHGINTYNWHIEKSLEEALSQGMPPNLLEGLERINREAKVLLKAVNGEVG